MWGFLYIQEECDGAAASRACRNPSRIQRRGYRCRCMKFSAVDGICSKVSRNQSAQALVNEGYSDFTERGFSWGVRCVAFVSLFACVSAHQCCVDTRRQRRESYVCSWFWWWCLCWAYGWGRSWSFQRAVRGEGEGSSVFTHTHTHTHGNCSDGSGMTGTSALH